MLFRLHLLTVVSCFPGCWINQLFETYFYNTGVWSRILLEMSDSVKLWSGAVTIQKHDTLIFYSAQFGSFWSRTRSLQNGTTRSQGQLSICHVVSGDFEPKSANPTCKPAEKNVISGMHNSSSFSRLLFKLMATRISYAELWTLFTTRQPGGRKQ